MREILHHAKLEFIKNPAESHSGVLELCDTFLGQLELMDKIVASKAPVQVQLADFSDSNRARTLRDRLVDLQLFDLARDLSVRCQLPLDPVWLAWGMQNLRDRKFTDARDVFKHVLTPAETTKLSSTTSPSTSTLGIRRAASVSSKGLDSQRVVESIVQVLDPGFSQIRRELSPPPLRRPSISSPAQPQDASTLSSSASPALEPVPEIQQSPRLEPEARVECVRHRLLPILSLYAFLRWSGLPGNLIPLDILSGDVRIPKVSVELLHAASINRRMCELPSSCSGRHGRLCRYCHTLLSTAFSPQRIETCHPEARHATATRFIADHSLLTFTYLIPADPSLTSFKTFLLAACKYFNERKAFKVLVTFQIFMEDFSRAALTCIKVFLDTTDHHHRLKCLEVAKDYFTEAIRRLRTSTESAPPKPSGPSAPPPSPGGSAVLSAADMEKCTSWHGSRSREHPHT